MFLILAISEYHDLKLCFAVKIPMIKIKMTIVKIQIFEKDNIFSDYFIKI